jgi:hypothetical protein
MSPLMVQDCPLSNCCMWCIYLNIRQTRCHSASA